MSSSVSPKIRRASLYRTSKLAEQAAKNNGEEICGLLVNNGYFFESILAKNKRKTGGGFAFYVNEI
jgi:hypothetical protein